MDSEITKTDSNLRNSFKNFFYLEITHGQWRNFENTEKLKENLKVITSPKYPVNLKYKITSYFTSKMSLFGNGRGIAIQDMLTTANCRQVQRKKERNVTL